MSSPNDNCPVDACERREHAHALRNAVDRPPGAFQPRDRCVVVDRDDEPVTKRTRFFEIRDMARMQNVEAAVREHDAFAGAARVVDRLDQFVARQHAAIGVTFRCEFATQFRYRHRRRAGLRDHDAGREIRQHRAFVNAAAGCEARRKRRRHGIARARFVEHVDRARGNVMVRAVAFDHGHTFFAARHDQRAEVEAVCERHGRRRRVRDSPIRRAAARVFELGVCWV